MATASHPEDLDLARRVQAGDEEAARELLAALGPEMLAWARSMLGDAAEAEDAFQEAMAGALRNLGTYTGQASLKSWLYGILRHKILDLQRRRGRSALIQAPPEDPELESFTEAGTWRSNMEFRVWDESAEVLEVVLACIESLPARQKEALLLRARQGLSAAEVADILGTTDLNVRQIVHRARQAVRRCAEARLEPSDP